MKLRLCLNVVEMDFMFQLELYLIEVLVNIDVLSKCVFFKVFLNSDNGDAITVVGSVVYHFCGLNHIHAV